MVAPNMDRILSLNISPKIVMTMRAITCIIIPFVIVLSAISLSFLPQKRLNSDAVPSPIKRHIANAISVNGYTTLVAPLHSMLMFCPATLSNPLIWPMYIWSTIL